MARQHGVTSTSYDKIVLDAGKLVMNYGEVGEANLGATRGGSTLSINTEYREMSVDGAKGPVKGSRRITKVEAILTVNMVELSGALFVKALTGADIADYPDTPTKTHDSITRALDVAAGDYLTNVAIVAQVSGKASTYLVGILKNVIADGNFELGLVENDESVLSIQFKAHFDPADLDTEPWELRWPT